MAEVASAFVNEARRFCVIAVMAAALAACTQHTVVSEKAASLSTSRHDAAEPARKVASVTHRRAAAATRKHPPASKQDAESPAASHGLASFYRHQSAKTANGEMFNPSELTAAHRTLPFGTRVRVTNVATGQSVTVRVNDRGPFVNGRVVDVSHGAADKLGITGQGVAKVKLEVVQ
jgi:peptidoglycan lytic transglycosylase